MPSDKPKIQAYIDSALYQRFEQWKQEREIDKDSSALNQLMAEYFGFHPQSPIPNPSASISAEEIEEKIEAECELWAEKIQQSLAQKLPTLSEIERQIDAVVNQRFNEQSQRWMDELNERFHERIFRLEQRLEHLKIKWQSQDEKFQRKPGQPIAVLEKSAPQSESPGNSNSDLPGDLPGDSISDLPSLNCSQLARRLGVNHGTISKNRNKPDFGAWTRARDPDAIAWSYDASRQRYMGSA